MFQACPCKHCNKPARGQQYQTAITVTRHLAKYGPYEPAANARPESTHTSQGRNRARSASPLPGVPSGGDAPEPYMFQEPPSESDSEEVPERNRRQDTPQEERAGAEEESSTQNAATGVEARAPPTQVIQRLQDTIWIPASAVDVCAPGSDVDPEDEPQLVPAAYAESSGVRMAYLQACIANVYANMSVTNATNLLNGTLNILEVVNALPTIPRPVRTLQSAKRRLGLDTEQHITVYAICPRCWKHYTLSQLRTFNTPTCLITGCDGVVYDEYRAGNGQSKRKPRKTNPYTSIIHTLRRFMRRPGFPKLIRDNTQPSNRRWHNNNEDFIMEDVCHGSRWNECVVNTRREVGDLGSVRDTPCSENGQQDLLNEHRYGLHLTVNTDWFQLLENRSHSTGPVYITINDLPREHRFLQVNVICPFVMPGPAEPNAEQMNHAFEPLASELVTLKSGVEMDIFEEDSQAVYADCMFDDCDTPAARKLSGTAGHSADLHPCPWCDFVLIDLNKSNMFPPIACRHKDDSFLLKQAFRSRGAAHARQEQILQDYGIRWSVMNVIPDWKPSSKTALDFMHNIFLGVVAHFFREVLFAAHMFSGTGGSNSGKQRLERFVNGFQWPSHITRLPKNLGENQNVKKADEWRQLLTIAPVLLWFTWRESQQETIPDSEPPIAPNEKISKEHSRNRRMLYEAALFLCAGVRLLSTRTITLRQARTGQDFLEHFCRALLALGVTLVINHHLSMHLYEMICAFGPVYAWWLFAFERFNGMLSKVNHNGHDGGEMETTLLRNWVQTQLIYDLLVSLPADAPAKEREMLNQVIQSESRQRGSMMQQILVFQSEVDTDSVKLSRNFSKYPIDLMKQDPTGRIYRLLLRYSQLRWPDMCLIPEFTVGPGLVFPSSNVARTVPFIRKDGLRYGSQKNKRTQSDSLALILTPDGARSPAQILQYFVLHIPNSGLPPHVCALVRRLFSDDDIPPFPWDLFASTLGIYVSYAQRYHDEEIIPVADICAPLGFVQLDSHGKRLLISISFDHVGMESDDSAEDYL